MNTPSDPTAPLIEPALRARLDALLDEGWELCARFDADVRQKGFHPFIPADYEEVLAALLPFRAPGVRFLEWGSGNGVITIMADLLGFEAFGIELDGDLVAQARALAQRTGSAARFAAGSFLPAGYRLNRGSEKDRLGTIGTGPSGYVELGIPLDEFDLVFGYPWSGEEPIMLDLMSRYGRADARLLLAKTSGGVKNMLAREIVVAR